MHGDKKIGLALGILLVGIVGAFFFRNDTDQLADAPRMKDPQALDDRISERSLAPYIVRRREMTSRPETVRSRYVPATPAYSLPDFLQKDPYSRTNELFGPPDPIPMTDRQESPVERIAQPILPQRTTEPVYQPEREPATQTGEYTIQDGDTLSELAERFMGGSSRYRDLYEMNRDRLRSANDLRVGIKIRIPSSPNQRTRVARAEQPYARPPVQEPSRRPVYQGDYFGPNRVDDPLFGRAEVFETPRSQRRIYIEQQPPRDRMEVVEEPTPRRRKLVLQSIGSGAGRSGQ
ncbi:LysM peptidoglycan-binding domain-containing protein [bacterium]|nr:LysM peptidoglycan-binding domain-containing protein [bacterium]